MKDGEKDLGINTILNPNTGENLSDEEKLLKTQRELMFGVLRSSMDIHQVKDIIQKNVPEKRQENVLHCIGFFSTTLPDIAEQLLRCVEGKNLEKYVDLGYQNIYTAIDVRINLTYHDRGNTATPGKQEIQSMITNIQDKKNMVDRMRSQTGEYIRGSGPTVSLGLLPTEWIDI